MKICNGEMADAHELHMIVDKTLGATYTELT